MAVKSVHDLLVDELRDLYHAEKQLVKALPKMAKAAKSDKLRQAFEHHLEETKGQVERLETVFDKLEMPARAKRCEAMAGLIEEAQEMIEEIKTPEVLDAALIAAAQKVEHYEIASYGSVARAGRGARQARSRAAAQPDPRGGEVGRSEAQPDRALRRQPKGAQGRRLSPLRSQAAQGALDPKANRAATRRRLPFFRG